MNSNFIVTGLIFIAVAVSIAIALFLGSPFGVETDNALSFAVVCATTGSVVACTGLVANNKGAGEE